MSSEIRISVVLPSYNSERCIEKAIESFLKQEYSNKELIIVDGKSTDSTHGIIQNYISKYDCIRWIQEKDINVTDAINIGIKHTTGDFISFLAADVFYYDNDLFETINKNYSQINFDAIYFDYYCHYVQQNKVVLHKCPNITFTKNNLLEYGTIVGFDNIFISKKVYELNLYNPDFNLVSDWEFFLRISQQPFLFFYVEKVCTINVQDGNNLSIVHSKDQINQIKEVGNLYNTDKLTLYFDKLIQPTIFVPTLLFKIKSKSKDLLKKALGK